MNRFGSKLCGALSVIFVILAILMGISVIGGFFMISQGMPAWAIAVYALAGVLFAVLGFVFSRIANRIDKRMNQEAELRRQEEKASTGISKPGVLQDLAVLLRSKGLSYSVEGTSGPTYRRQNAPFLRLETTQLFTNGECGITYLNKQWRSRMLPPRALGSIDISVTDDGGAVVSACSPTGTTNTAQVMEQVEALIAQGDGKIIIYCEEFLGIPYIEECVTPANQARITDDWCFGTIELFALEVHRIFGGIVSSRS